MNCIWVKDRKCLHESVPDALVSGKPVVDELTGLRVIGSLLICINCQLGRLSEERRRGERRWASELSDFCWYGSCSLPTRSGAR